MGQKLIKRADGSYSERGLWDNIRANRGSNKKPTEEMLKQEKKIKSEENKLGGLKNKKMKLKKKKMTGGQYKLDMNKNGKLDGQDFKMLGNKNNKRCTEVRWKKKKR